MIEAFPSLSDEPIDDFASAGHVMHRRDSSAGIERAELIIVDVGRGPNHIAS